MLRSTSTAARTVRAISGVKTRPMMTVIPTMDVADGHDEQERDDHEGNREEGLDEPPGHRVEGAADVAHGQAEGGAEDGAEDGGQRGDDQDVPGPGDDPGQHVAAERVGAEPVRRRRGGVVEQQLLRERVVRREQVAEHGADHPEQQDGRAHVEHRPAQQQPPSGRRGPARGRHRRRSGGPEISARAIERRDRVDRRRDARLGRLRDGAAHWLPPRRSRGLSAVSSRSAISVATT